MEAGVAKGSATNLRRSESAGRVRKQARGGGGSSPPPPRPFGPSRPSRPTAAADSYVGGRDLRRTRSKELRGGGGGGSSKELRRAKEKTIPNATLDTPKARGDTLADGGATAAAAGGDAGGGWAVKTSAKDRQQQEMDAIQRVKAQLMASHGS